MDFFTVLDNAFTGISKRGRFLPLLLLHNLKTGQTLKCVSGGDVRNLSREHMCQLMDKLEAEGLVAPTPTANRRSKPYALTEAGRALVARFARWDVGAIYEWAHRHAVSRVLTISVVYAKTLVRLADGQATPGELAGVCGVSTAAMTGVGDTLEKRGYMSRRVNPLDKRQVLFALTETGQRAANELRALLKQKTTK